MKENKIEISDSVKQFFAKDGYHNTILIGEIDECNVSKKYHCPMCNGTLIPCALNSDLVSSYFKHKSLNDCSSESMIHYWFKNEYIKNGDIIKLSVNNEIIEYECKSLDVEKSYKTQFGTYIPDVTVVTTCDEVIFLEFAHTNKKDSDKYSDIWRELDNLVIEVDIKQLQKRNTDEKIFSPIYYNGIIFKYDKRNVGDCVISRHANENKISDPYRIKYLNGFIRDCMRYNTGEISIDELAIIIESMNEADLLYIPKIIKGIKCHNILDDYSNYKFKNVKALLREELEKYNLKYEDYKWLIDNIYTQKWTKAKGARFNNTILVKKYHYSSYYNFNRCDYNDVSKGFEVFFINEEELTSAIKNTIKNEIERNDSIRKQKHREYLNQKRNELYAKILKHIKGIIDANIRICVMYDTVFFEMSDCEDFRLNIYKEILNFKGVKRKELINKLVFDICKNMNLQRKINKKKSKFLEYACDNEMYFQKQVSEILKDTEVKLHMSKYHGGLKFEFKYEKLCVYDFSFDIDSICDEDVLSSTCIKFKKYLIEWIRKSLEANTRIKQCLSGNRFDIDGDILTVYFMKNINLPYKNVYVKLNTNTNLLEYVYGGKNFYYTIKNNLQLKAIIKHISILL